MTDSVKTFVADWWPDAAAIVVFALGAAFLSSIGQLDTHHGVFGYVWYLGMGLWLGWRGAERRARKQAKNNHGQPRL